MIRNGTIYRTPSQRLHEAERIASLAKQAAAFFAGMVAMAIISGWLHTAMPEAMAIDYKGAFTLYDPSQAFESDTGCGRCFTDACVEEMANDGFLIGEE